MSLKDIDDIDPETAKEIFEFALNKGREIKALIVSKFPDDEKKSYLQNIKAASFIICTLISCIRDKRDRNAFIDEIAIMLKHLSDDINLMIDKHNKEH